MKNRTWLVVIILVVAGCLIVSVGLIVGLFVLRGGVNLPLISAPTPSPIVSLITPGAATPTLAPSGQSGTPQSTIPADIASQMDEIQQQVISYRGLQLKGPFGRELLTSAQLKDKVINDFFADYTAEDAQNDQTVLEAFGLLPANFDLHDFYIKLYSEQVAGYYDDKTKTMYVISDEAFGGPERMTYSHEFTHTLQDQNYDIENGLKVNTDNCKLDTEYCAAVTALMEGDATLSEAYWYTFDSTSLDKQQVQQFQQTYTSPVYDSAPAYMKQDFLFPYTQGLTFVQALYGNNGWKAVDDAYTNPPVSTEQILHPTKYPADKPIAVDLPDFTSTLGTGWSEIDRNVMGEWYMSLILGSGSSANFRLDSATANTAAAGWGGDTYLVYTNSSSSDLVMVWESTWDTNNDADEFWTASLDYGAKRWGNAQSQTSTSATWQTSDVGLLTMRRTSGQVLWLMTPTSDTASTLLSQIGTFGS